MMIVCGWLYLSCIPTHNFFFRQDADTFLPFECVYDFRYFNFLKEKMISTLIEMNV